MKKVSMGLVSCAGKCQGSFSPSSKEVVVLCRKEFLALKSLGRLPESSWEELDQETRMEFSKYVGSPGYPYWKHKENRFSFVAFMVRNIFEGKR